MPVTCLERERPRSLVLVTVYPYSGTGVCMHVCEGIWGYATLIHPWRPEVSIRRPPPLLSPIMYHSFVFLVDLMGSSCLNSKYWGCEHIYNLNTYVGPGDSKSGLNVHTENI